MAGKHPARVYPEVVGVRLPTPQGRRKRTTTLTVYRGRNGKWYYRKVAGNGEKTQGSQGYASASGARRAARSQNPGVVVTTVR
jgi:uncharacterized protein YegP (UPF0339 family)